MSFGSFGLYFSVHVKAECLVVCSLRLSREASNGDCLWDTLDAKELLVQSAERVKFHRKNSTIKQLGNESCYEERFSYGLHGLGSINVQIEKGT
jgi:hypothetical protein